MSATNWTLNATEATAASEKFSLTLNPSNPLNPLVIRDQTSGHGPTEVAWQAMAVEPHPAHQFQVEEAYVRESDLIVRFKQSASDVFAMQFNWRLISQPEVQIFGVELWISVQTDRLDTAPWLQLTSQLPDARWQAFRHSALWNDCHLASVANSSDEDSVADVANVGVVSADGDVAALAATLTTGSSCVWLIEPTDQGQFQLASDSHVTCQQARLFGAFLEKGVIRRARMQLLMIGNSLYPQQLSELYQAFAKSPLPLTA